jgi:hypothetical protein
MADLRRVARLSLAMVLLARATCALADDDLFHRIRKLQGTWLAVDEKGQVTEQVISIFRVTSNGHTVEEIMFPGSTHEMVNMYYRDGDEVRVTHYCAGGNQPTLRLLPTPRSGVLQLEFVDITNMITIDDEHMHEGQYQWVDDNHLKTEWHSYKNGRYLDTSRFDMVRLRR